MRTRSSSNLLVVSHPNPSTSNTKRRNHRHSKQPFLLEESPVDTMANQCTMAELLHAPTEGYAEAIVVPSILAEQFELKHSLINMMTLDQFFRLENNNPHDHIHCKATGNSPFELVTGRQPLTHNALAASYEGSRPGAYKTMREWYKQADLARASLDKAAKKMKKWVDERRRHVEFKVGDQVMVKLLLQQFKSLKNVHKGLIRRYEGPFSMIGRVGKVSYRVQLPLKLKIHPVFYVSFLKPYHGDE
nr:hypothetical protein CTI12_AA187700 [Tanacetum cinerariifolium]